MRATREDILERLEKHNAPVSFTQSLQDMKKLYEETRKVEFAKTNNWVRVGGKYRGKTFNGVTRGLFYKIIGERENGKR